LHAFNEARRTRSRVEPGAWKALRRPAGFWNALGARLKTLAAFQNVRKVF